MRDPLAVVFHGLTHLGKDKSESVHGAEELGLGDHDHVADSQLLALQINRFIQAEDNNRLLPFFLKLLIRCLHIRNPALGLGDVGFHRVQPVFRPPPQRLRYGQPGYFGDEAWFRFAGKLCDIGNVFRRKPFGLDSSGMISVFPERPFPLLTDILFLSCPARNQLKAFRNSFFTGVNDKQVDVIRSGNIIEHTKAVSFSGLKKPISPAPSVFVKFKEKLLFMAPMCYMPNATWDVMPVCSRHKDEPWRKGVIRN